MFHGQRYLLMLLLASFLPNNKLATRLCVLVLNDAEALELLWGEELCGTGWIDLIGQFQDRVVDG